ncbi:endolytic transglycosylase MltG [Acetonema longum]|uniref:Endolytic murein transglycosylase n=1 Tax=Acetonema longum DSM 6540 TaxID=1009370 RepID=F7NI85_9FIRM|nr:endolytic transglycosylase MltG [Acetonema longum]EGO64250.1 aminodeoxychorismate lyase [Acetonema longum DSM 6540]
MLKKIKKLRWILVGLAILISISGFLLGTVAYDLAQPVSTIIANPIIVTVKPGMSARDIGDMLYAKGLIKNVFLFRVVARIEGMENSLQAAEYAFTPNMSVQRMVKMLATGEISYRQFTIPEGYTINQIATLLEEKQLADAVKFKELAKDLAPYEYIQHRPELAFRVEGFAFPDTYKVKQGITEEQLLRMMVYQFNEQFTQAMRDKAAQMGLSIYEVIILASLVEKEAQVEADRPIIAGVFLKRLKMHMPLQSCATIQYILGYPKPELTIEDTQLPSPYNTYLHMGLPPGPIANPGIAAIQAVLNPTQTDYLYFVADSSGRHHFSKTYTEHLAAISRVSN